MVECVAGEHFSIFCFYHFNNHWQLLLVSVEFIRINPSKKSVCFVTCTQTIRSCMTQLFASANVWQSLESCRVSFLQYKSQNAYLQSTEQCHSSHLHIKPYKTGVPNVCIRTKSLNLQYKQTSCTCVHLHHVVSAELILWLHNTSEVGDALWNCNACTTPMTYIADIFSNVVYKGWCLSLQNSQRVSWQIRWCHTDINLLWHVTRSGRERSLCMRTFHL